MIYKQLSFLLICVVISLPTVAGVFRWEDPPGKINFSSVPPEPIEKYQFGTWSSEFTERKQKQKQREEDAKKKVHAEELAKEEKQKEIAAKIAIMHGPSNDMSAEEDEIKNQEVSIADIEKIELDKCGVFKAYVQDYKNRLTPGCESKVCKIYAQQLKKYKMKSEKYCK